MKTKALLSFLIILIITVSWTSKVRLSDNERRDNLRDSILSLIKPPSLPATTYVLTKFGAKGDSVTDCKPALDKAIEKCRKTNGGTIIIPAGKYLIDGPIHLVSNVCLKLEKGSRLIFSSNDEKYLPVVKTSWEGTFLHNYSPFIYGYNLENISIIGEGVIDGRSNNTFQKWTDKQQDAQNLSRKMNHESTPVEKRIFGKGSFLRPQLLQLYKCRNILIENVTITDAPFWCIHLLQSENITVRGVKFNAHNKNNDGVDPEYSKNILIENIDFDNGDDNIAIKAGRDHEGRATATPSENIIIRNCKFKGLHGVVMGSEMSAGVRNVFIENCTYRGYCKRGIYIKSNPDRGGYVKDIFVKNVEFGTVEDCFFITSFYHGEGKGFATDIYNVFVEDLHCRKATNAGIVIQGYPEKKVHDIHFSNVMIDTASIGVSMTNAQNIILNDVSIGGIVGVPSAVK
jgi:polygalacturonase